MEEKKELQSLVITIKEGRRSAMQPVRDYGLIRRLNELLPGSRPQLLYNQTTTLRELIDDLSRLLTGGDGNVPFPFAQLPSNYQEALRKANLHLSNVSSSSITEALESQVEDIIRNSDTVLKLIDDELIDFIISLHLEVGFSVYNAENLRDISRSRTTNIIFNNKVTWESLVPYLSLRKNVSRYSHNLASELYEKLETKAMVLVSESIKIQDAINDIVYKTIFSIFVCINNDNQSWVMVDRPLSLIGDAVSMVINCITGPFTTVDNEVWRNCLVRASNVEYVFTVVLWYGYRDEPCLNIMRVKFQQYDFGVVVSPRYFPTSFDTSEGNRCFYLASGIGMRVHPLEIIRQMRVLAQSALDNVDYLEYLRQHSNIVVDRSSNTDGSIVEMFQEILSRGKFFDMDALRYLWPECFRNKMLCVFSFDNKQIGDSPQHKFKACPFYQHPVDDNISQENIIYLHHNGVHFALLQPQEITKEVSYDRGSTAELRLETNNFFQSMKDTFDEHNRTLVRMNESNIPCNDYPIPYQPNQMSLIYDPAKNYGRFLRK